jgi:multidrug efflux pump subunit AcrB
VNAGQSVTGQPRDGGAAGLDGVKAGLIAYFAGNPVAANLLMAGIAVIGLLAATTLVVRDTPRNVPHIVEVVVESPGSSAREVEEDIVRRVEEAVIGISGVERVLGTAVADLGTVLVEYSPLADGAGVLQDVENAVDGIDNFPPPNAKEPEIEPVRPEITAVTLAVSSPHLNQDSLQRTAENIRGELMQLPGISDVSLRGVRDREVSIELDEEQLRRYGLSFEAIAGRVGGSSLNLSFGELDTESGQVALHTVSKRQSGAQFADIPLVTNADGTIIRLGDVAEIRDAFAPDDRVVLTVNGIPAVLVTVGVADWQSLTDVAAEVREWLAGFARPAEITVSVWNDTADLAVKRTSAILRNVVMGVLLVFVLLILVLDLRVAVWVTLGIPLAFVGSFTLIAVLGLTINVVTISAFFLVAGLVVDDALIVAENIDTERTANPRQPLAAAIRGARVVRGPVTVGAITTALAFLPLLFLEGDLQVIRVLSPVLICVLVVSLIEAFLILPAHLSHPGSWTLSPLRELQSTVSEMVDRLRERTVAPAVSWAVRHVWTTFAAAALVVLAGVLLLATGAVRFITFTGSSSVGTNIRADLYLPVGTPFETTLATARRVANEAAALDDTFGGSTVHGVSMFVGNLFSASGDEDEVHVGHLASVVLHLADKPERAASAIDVEAAWARRIGKVPLLERFAVGAHISSVGDTIDYALRHDDESTLRSATDQLKSFMTSIPGVSGVWDSLAPGKRHIDIQVTPAGQAAGLTPADIGRQLRANYHGLVIQELQRGPDEVEVVLRYPPERRRSLRELSAERVLLGTPSGYAEMPLSTAATMVERREPATLTRIDGERAARVSANVDPAVLTIRQVHARIKEELLPTLLTAHPGLRFEEDGYGREERALFTTAAVTVPAALLAVYALIAAFLRSYWKPLVAVLGFPLAFAGAVFAHWLLGWDFGGTSFFGVVAVSGVVVNDALVLLDRYNTIRREDSALPAIAAVAAATRNRFRAVFLTTATTLVALCPLLYERSDLLVFLVPFVVAMFGGLVLSGVFTLFILPALVMAVEGRK